MSIELHPSLSRGLTAAGWLVSRHSFSFADHYDPERLQFGALRVLNDDLIAPEAGFPMHRHQDMEIVTIPLTGSLRHKDDLGNTAVVQAGEVQAMSAGTGVHHAEFNASASEYLSLLQIWIQTATRGIPASYRQLSFAPDVLQNQLTLLAGPIENKVENVVGMHQDAYISRGQFDQAATIDYTLRKTTHGVYLFCIAGSITVEGVTANKGDALAITDTQLITLLIAAGTDVVTIEVPMSA
ncbi:pirin family protein [Patescibacteria group bacterium]|nr:pirin family protein [Patescibacteria group bacterium]